MIRVASRTKTIVRNFVLVVALLVIVSPAVGDDSDAAAANWPQWRGPRGDATSDATGLPVSWSENENIAWKAPLPAFSGSTPIVWGDRIFLTSPEKPEPRPAADTEGRKSRDPGGASIYLHCLSRSDGSELWKRHLSDGNELKMKHNMASPSPVTDGLHVWTMTGLGELVAFDFDGNEKWRRNLQDDYGAFGINWGFSSSPLLHQDRLVIPVLQGYKTDDPSYLVAISKDSGETLWKTERPTDAIKESPDAYITPQLYRGDPLEVIVNGADVVTGHDFLTGAELWRVDGLNPKNTPSFRIVGSCVIAGGIIIAPTRVQPMLAIRPGGRGDVTQTHVLWEAKGADVPTPVSDGKYLWVVSDRGVFSCYDLKTGKPTHEPQRLARGTCSASPVLADGKIYVINESAITTVLRASPNFEILATNELDDPYVLSTPAIAGQEIFIRATNHLYCIRSM